LKNIGGVDFTALTTIIECSDTYITINDNSGYFGVLPVDSTRENTGDPYMVTASGTTPQGHSAEFRLITTDGSFVDTFNFNIVIGTYHYLVWNPDPTPTSGQEMHNILTALNYTGNYSTTLPTRAELDIYQAVFVCVGIYSNNYIIGASSAEASALVDYLNNGGRMYLEGGDVWYYDPPYQGGYNFGPLFGINPTADGTSDGGPFAGQTGTFTEGMDFAYAGENAYIDHISPIGTGFLIFYDTDNAYDAGVANDAGTYRTVGTSFELGGLTDGSGVSTKAALLDSIMHFYGIFVVGIDEVSQDNVTMVRLELCPNPFSKKMNIKFSIPVSTARATLKIYDATGRLVRDFPVDLCNQNKSVKSVCWYGNDKAGCPLSNGVYFVHLDADDYRAVRKIILVE